MQTMPIAQAAGLIADQLPKGVFLCVDGDTPNVMAVGWGGLSYYWLKDVFVAPVRKQRHTHPLLEKERAFTICVPHPGSMQKEIAAAGTLSGRDGDKFAAIGLQTAAAQTVSAPIIKGCALYLECRVRATNAFMPETTDAEIIDYTYTGGDYHTLFYGEITACYAGE